MLSVIICTFNGAKRITPTLKSLAEQTLDKRRFEVLIIDNGSTDNGEEIVKNFIKEFDLTLRYFYEEHIGKSHALNRGIQESRGDSLAFIDDDAIADKHWLFHLETAFESMQPSCIGGKVIPVWHGKCPNWFWGKMKNFVPILDLGDKVRLFTPPANFPCGTNMAVRREITEKVGLFDVNLGHVAGKLVGSEETDYCMRIQQEKGNLLYYPFAVVYHPFDRRQLTKAYLRRRCFTQGTATAYIHSKGKTLMDVFSQNFKYLFAIIFNRERISSNSTLTVRDSRKKRKPNIFYLELKLIFYLGYIYAILFRKVIPMGRKNLHEKKGS